MAYLSNQSHCVCGIPYILQRNHDGPVITPWGIDRSVLQAPRALPSQGKQSRRDVAPEKSASYPHH